MQMREFRPQKVKQAAHAMVMVTPLKALYVDCTEVSQVFNEEGIEGMKVRLFSENLYLIFKAYITIMFLVLRRLISSNERYK